MNHPWAISIAREDAGSLASLRLVAGIEVADCGETIWLRGRGGDDQANPKILALPARGRHEWLANNSLRRVDRRIPDAQLPANSWQPLNAWLRVEMPVAAYPASVPAPISLKQVHSTEEREPELLLTRIEDLRQFAEDAAQVRLDRLKFAGDAAGNVLVRGTPLPSLPGRRFVLHGRVAVPAGRAWAPAIGADALAKCIGVSGDDLVLWNEDGTTTRLHVEQFVPATRSAIMATQLALAEPT